VHGLVALVAESLAAQPYSGDVFVSRAKRADRLKLPVFDGTGMILATKWLEESRFAWPPIEQGTMRLSATQLTLLLEGLEDRARMAAKPINRPMKLC
jgi:transposase